MPDTPKGPAKRRTKAAPRKAAVAPGAKATARRTPSATSRAAAVGRATAATPAVARVSSPRRPSALLAGWHASLRLLDAYEHTALAYADYEERVAAASRSPWIQGAVRAKASARRRQAHVSARAARQLLGV